MVYKETDAELYFNFKKLFFENYLDSKEVPFQNIKNRILSQEIEIPIYLGSSRILI